MTDQPDEAIPPYEPTTALADTAEQAGYAAVWHRFNSGHRIADALGSDLNSDTQVRINAWLWHHVQAAICAALTAERGPAGVGSDGTAPTDRPGSPLAAEQAAPVAQYPPTPHSATQAVPEVVRQAAWDAVTPNPEPADPRVDTAIDATWQAAHRLFGGMIAYEVTCLRCVDQLDQLAAERAAGIEEGIRAAADFVADAANEWTDGPWTGDIRRTIRTIAGRVRDLEAHDAAEPLHIAGYQPDPAPAESVLTLQDRANEAARQERAEANWAATVGAELDRGTAIREIFRSPAVQAAGFGISAAQASANIRKNLDALLADSDTPPDLIPPADATSAAEFARYNETHPRLIDYRQRVEARLPAVEQVFTTSRLVATLDRALALLHDLLDQHWLDIPGSPPGQPGVMRIVDTDRLTEWRERMAAIEETNHG